MLFAQRKSFTISGVSDAYAAQIVTIRPEWPLFGVTAGIESTAAGVNVELWLLRVGGDYTNNAHYFRYATSTSSVTWPLAGYAGAQIRARSAVAAGTTVVNVTAA